MDICSGYRVYIGICYKIKDIIKTTFVEVHLDNIYSSIDPTGLRMDHYDASVTDSWEADDINYHGLKPLTDLHLQWYHIIRFD